MRELAQHELHDLAGFRLRDDEADHALQRSVELRGRRGSTFRRHALGRKRLLGDGLDGVDDEACAG